MSKNIAQIKTDDAWQCPGCGDWFTDGENECGDCGIKKVPRFQIRQYKAPADWWREDDGFLHQDWFDEVRAHNTLLGYWEWVAARRYEQENN